MNIHLSFGKKLGTLVALVAFCIGCACNGGSKPSNCSTCPSSAEAKPVIPWVPVFFASNSLLTTKTAKDAIDMASADLARQEEVLRADEGRLRRAAAMLEKQKASMNAQAHADKSMQLAQWQQAIMEARGNLAKSLDTVATQQTALLGSRVLWFARVAEGNSKDPFVLLRREATLLTGPALKDVDWTPVLTNAAENFDKVATPPANLSVPTTGTLRVAFLRMEDVFQGTRAGRVLLQQVASAERDETIKLRERGTALENRAKDLKKQAPSMKPAEVIKSEAALKAEFTEIATAEQTLGTRLQTRRAELFKPLEDRVRLILRAMASQGLFDFVLLSTAAYFPSVPYNDVTQSVIQYIEQNTDLPTGPSKRPSLSNKLGKEVSIFTLDMGRLLKTSKYARSLVDAAEKEKSEAQNALQKTAAELEADTNNLRKKITEGTIAPRAAKNQEVALNKRRTDLSDKYLKAQKEFAAKGDALTLQFSKAAESAVAALYPQSIVFTSNVVAYEGGLPDITDRVQEKMDVNPLSAQNAVPASLAPAPSTNGAPAPAKAK